MVFCCRTRSAGGGGRNALWGRSMDKMRNAKYMIGQVVKHRLYPFRGVVFDIDP